MPSNLWGLEAWLRTIYQPMFLSHQGTQHHLQFILPKLKLIKARCEDTGHQNQRHS